jgi:hypothetical protein
MLAELLRHSPDLLHFQAEINPMLRLVGLAFPDSGDSDYLSADHLVGLSDAARADLETDLALDAGTRAEAIGYDDFALNVAWRLLIQWPGLRLEYEELVVLVSQALRETSKRLGWPPRQVRDPSAFLLAVLRRLCAAGADVDPACYDLPGFAPSMARTRGLGGPPGDVLIEEPPFVVPRPWRRADDTDIATRPLVIKTPSNAYRLGFLRALFPRARFRVLHLTRNPAAAINGLYDGWLHQGFHSHRMLEPLQVDGYGADLPRERMWWKFDLPPGWRRLTGASLLEVCAFQWRSCHVAILSDVVGLVGDYLRIRCEDLTSGPQGRTAAITRIARWLDIPVRGDLARAASDGIAPVSATRMPAPGRWRARQGALVRVLDADVMAVARECGYGSSEDWV